LARRQRVSFLLLSYTHLPRPCLLSFPTRRSSDLYDLQQPGYTASMLNDYIAHENATHLAATGEPYLILQNAKFVQGKHEIYAIPNIEIDRSRIGTEATLKQNPNH